LCPLEVVHPANLFVEHFAIEKDQSTQCLILSRSRHFLLHGQMIEKLLHLAFAHLRRMSLVMKKDVALDPIDVIFLGTNAIALTSNRLTHPIEQSGLVILRLFILRICRRLTYLVERFRFAAGNGLSHLRCCHLGPPVTMICSCLEKRERL